MMSYAMDAPASGEQELISRLMTKVSEQALELGELSAQLDLSRQIIAEETFAASARSPDQQRTPTSSENMKAPLAESVSGAAVQRRLEKDHNMQMLALQRQLELTESKLAEHIKTKKKLLQDLDAKTREATFYVKKCHDVQLENQQLRHQVEQTLKMTSVTAKTKGVKQPLKSVDSITHFRTCDELKQAQSVGEQLKRELEASREREGQYRMRVKVLEEALEFRSEEIGLAGHSDLLAKVAKLRGEVSALKGELTNKHQKIAEVEDTKADLSDRHETLQRHVAQLQQRLSQSQQEMYRLQNGDVGELLRQAEAERDRLLKFVQTDMQKSTDLAKHVERLEEELRNVRREENSNHETVARLQATLDAEVGKYRQLEERFAAAMTQLKDLQQAHQADEAEKVALTNQFNRKSTEADELNRMQMNLFVQVHRFRNNSKVYDEVLDLTFLLFSRTRRRRKS
jgi:predicted nuclease with TOPRIM domain